MRSSPPHPEIKLSSIHRADSACPVAEPQSRRRFLAQSLTGSALLFTGLEPLARALAQSSAARPSRSAEFADIVELGERAWAVVSRLGARQTLCNGAIMAGDKAVLVIEGFNTPEGAAWVAEQARQLSGRRPTHVVVTHLHGDHVNGLAGYLDGGPSPQIISTRTTRRMMLERQMRATDEAQGAGLADLGGRQLLPDAVLAEPDKPFELDLGGRTVTLQPRSGHTPSDLTIHLNTPRVVVCGDLVFHGVFPYFGDATPTKLRASCTALLADEAARFVPGHGPLASAGDLKRYMGLLEDIETRAREAHRRGTPAVEAAMGYAIPPTLGDWFLYSPTFPQLAFEAWYRELGG